MRRTAIFSRSEKEEKRKFWKRSCVVNSPLQCCTLKGRVFFPNRQTCCLQSACDTRSVSFKKEASGFVPASRMVLAAKKCRRYLSPSAKSFSRRLYEFTLHRMVGFLDYNQPKDLLSVESVKSRCRAPLRQRRHYRSPLDLEGVKILNKQRNIDVGSKSWNTFHGIAVF